MSQKFGETIGTQNIEVSLSRLVKQTNVEKFQVCSIRTRMANVKRFSIEDIQGLDF